MSSLPCFFIDTNIWIRVWSQGQPGCEIELLDDVEAMVRESKASLILPELLELEIEKGWRTFKDDVTVAIAKIENSVKEALKNAKNIWNEVEDVKDSLTAVLLEAKQKKSKTADDAYARMKKLFMLPGAIKVPLTADAMFRAKKRVIAGRMPPTQSAKNQENDAAMIECLTEFFGGLPTRDLVLYFCSENVSDFGLETPEGIVLHPLVKPGLPPTHYVATLRELVEGFRSRAPVNEPSGSVIEEALENQLLASANWKPFAKCVAEGCRRKSWPIGPFCLIHLRQHLKNLSDWKQRDFWRRVESVLETLPNRERELFKLRYGLGDGYTYTRVECGRIFKITPAGVRFHENMAASHLKNPIRSKFFEDFF